MLQTIEKEAQQLDATRFTIKIESKKKARTRELRIKIKHRLEESSEKLKGLTQERDEAKNKLEQNEQILKYLSLQEQWQSDDSDLKSIIAEKMDEIKQLRHEVSKLKMELMQARCSQLTRASKQTEEISEEGDKATMPKNAELRAIIEHQENEIMHLQSHVADLESELSQAEENHKKHHEKLQQTTEDLAEQSEQVRILKTTQAGLERRRSQVDAMLKAEIARSEVFLACIQIHYIIYSCIYRAEVGD